MSLNLKGWGPPASGNGLGGPRHLSLPANKKGSPSYYLRRRGSRALPAQSYHLGPLIQQWGRTRKSPSLQTALNRLQNTLAQNPSNSLKESIQNLSFEQKNILKEHLGKYLDHFITLSEQSNPRFFYRGLFQIAQQASEDEDPSLAFILLNFLSQARNLKGGGDLKGLRQKAREELQVLKGEGPLGRRIEKFASQFLREVTRPPMLVGLGVGSLVAGATRLGFLARLAKSPAKNFLTTRTGAYLASNTAAFLAEVPAVYLASHSTEALINPQVSLSDFSHAPREILSLGAMLAFLKLGGATFRGVFNWGHGVHPLSGRVTRAEWLTRYSQPLVHQLGMFSGLYAFHRLNHHLSGEAPMGNGQALTQSLATLLQFNAAGWLAQRTFGTPYHKLLQKMAGRTQEARYQINRKGLGLGLLSEPLLGLNGQSSLGIRMPIPNRENNRPKNFNNMQMSSLEGKGDKLSLDSATQNSVEWGYRGRSGDRIFKSQIWVRKHLNLKAWLEKAPELTREEFFLKLLELKIEIQKISKDKINLAFVLRGLRKHQLKDLKDASVNDALIKEANSLNAAVERWSKLGPYFQNLAQMPLKGNYQGWTRHEYAAEYLRQPNGKEYSYPNVSQLTRWGVFLFRHHDRLGLQTPKVISIEGPPHEALRNYQGLRPLIKRLNASNIESGLKTLLESKPKIEEETGVSWSLRDLLLKLQRSGLKGFRGKALTSTAFSYASQIDRIIKRWSEWGPIFANLAIIPKNKSRSGWTRSDYARVNILQEGKKPYTETSLKNIVRWGLFLIKNHKRFNLPWVKPSSLKPRIDTLLPEKPLEPVPNSPSSRFLPLEKIKSQIGDAASKQVRAHLNKVFLDKQLALLALSLEGEKGHPLQYEGYAQLVEGAQKRLLSLEEEFLRFVTEERNKTSLQDRAHKFGKWQRALESDKKGLDGLFQHMHSLGIRGFDNIFEMRRQAIQLKSRIQKNESLADYFFNLSLVRDFLIQKGLNRYNAENGHFLSHLILQGEGHCVSLSLLFAHFSSLLGYHLSIGVIPRHVFLIGNGGAAIESTAQFAVLPKKVYEENKIAENSHNKKGFEILGFHLHHAGRVAMEQGNLEYARKSFGRAQNIIPQNPSTYYHWGQYYQFRGLVEPAVENFMRYAEMYPDSHPAISKVGDRLLRLNQQFPDSIKVYEGLEYVFRRLGKEADADAMRDFREFMEISD